MSICGYNDKIGNGLRLLVEGMADALEKKATHASVHEVLDKELIELNAMIETLRSDGDALPKMFVGLNILAKALFEQVQADLESASASTLEAGCSEVGESFVRLLAETEARSEELRHDGEMRSADRFARELAHWALERSKHINRETAFS